MKATFTYLFGYRSTKNIDYWGKQIWSRNILLLCCLFQNFILPGITFPIVPLINDYVNIVIKKMSTSIFILVGRTHRGMTINLLYSGSWENTSLRMHKTAQELIEH
jgi:hypothetical protein